VACFLLRSLSVCDILVLGSLPRLLVCCVQKLSGLCPACVKQLIYLPVCGMLVLGSLGRYLRYLPVCGILVLESLQVCGMFVLKSLKKARKLPGQYGTYLSNSNIIKITENLIFFVDIKVRILIINS